MALFKAIMALLLSFFLFYGSFNSDYMKCNTLPESPLKTSEIRWHQQSWPNPEKTHIIWEIDKKLILKSKIMTDDKNMWLEILDLGLIIVAQFSRESSSSPCPCIHPSASSCIPLRSPGTDPVCLLWTHRAPWEVCWSMTIRACWFFWASPDYWK